MPDHEKIIEVDASARQAHFRLDGHEKRLDDHDKTIGALCASDAKHTSELAILCRQMSDLTKAIWGLVITVITVLAGFFIWFIESGAGK